MVETLLDKGANVNSRDREGCSSLQIAVEIGKRPFLECFWIGADVNFQDKKGQRSTN